ncbi:asparagine synthase (glutamine-hydrolyzing) [Fundidesulfovibrio butyratiphilus]
MCGICGQLAFGGAVADPAGIEAMRRALAHRGPDDSGVLTDGPAALGHTRLSIIDLSPLGHQPLRGDDPHLSIVFNGEIYNYREIRSELEACGRTFTSATDTEVALTAISHWGVAEALPRFVGMFAIAVWDGARRTLTLVRDRLGVKPLYYALSPEGLLFASEVRAILAHPAHSARLDRRALSSFLMTGYFPGDETALAGVRKLDPGTWMEISPDGSMAKGRYWSLEGLARGAYSGSFEAAADELRALFDSAFGYRLVSDVPVGMFLSGGVDSSLVAAVLRKDLDVRLRSFTIGFAERGFDEAAKAQSLCAALDLPHEVLRAEPAMAQQVLDTFCDVYDEPFGDASGIPTILVSRLARRTVTVALSADGGDELFCGYTGHMRYPRLYEKFSALPARLRRALAGLARSLPLGALSGGSLTRKGQERAARLGRLLALLGAGTPRELLAVYAARGFFAHEAAPLLGLEKTSLPVGFLHTALETEASPEQLGDMLMRHDVRYWLPDDILVKVDRASMHVGLECRDPLLDHRVAEFAAALPMEYLCKDGVQKRILRHLLHKLVGPEAARQPKLGFDIPLGAWLSGPWRSHLDRHLGREALTATGLFDPDPARAVVERFLAGRGESPWRVWLLLTAQMWAARWLPGGRA